MKNAKRVISFLLAVCMLMTTALATVEETDVDSTEEQGKFSFENSLASFSEDSGIKQVSILRTGDVSKSASVKVAAYDFNAEYGADYRLYQDDKPVKAKKNAASLYNAFRDDSFTIDSDQLDAALETGALMQKESESDEEQTAGEKAAAAQETAEQALGMLEDIGAKVAEITVDFAPGQKSGTFTVEILGDEDSEYDEAFACSLESKSGVGENWIMTGTISDNEEEKPVNTVSLAKASAQVDADTEKAELWFDRTGDLAAFSSVVLCKDGEAYGYVNFRAYQDQQMVEVPAGTYQLANPTNCQVGELVQAVVTGDPEKEAQTDEMEPGLDIVPKYSALAGQSQATVSSVDVPSWMSSWATTASTETEDYITVLGSTTNELFKLGGTDGKGAAWFNGPRENSYKLDTSGTGSRVSTGYVYIDAKANYDMTGIASITGCFDVSGLDYDAQVKLGVYKTCSTVKDVDDNSYGEITCELPDYCQDSRYVFYENIDPSGTDDGCEVWALNGFKMNKREYYVVIEQPDALEYTDGAHAVNIDGNDARMYKKMGDGTNDASKINIVYDSAKYPQQLIGYQLVNRKNQKTSDIIKLNGSSQIVFSKDFLKKYEKDYFYSAQDIKDKEYCTVSIKPVMAKTQVDDFQLVESELGTIELTNATDGKLYKGDTAVFVKGDRTEDGVSLAGVYVQARQKSNDVWVRWTQYADSDDKARVVLDEKYDDYIFQGYYNSDARELKIQYADGASQNGQLVSKVTDGIVVPKSEYVVNDYYPLMAKANEGYVTQWKSNGRVYYGDTFYYQLDGNPDNNIFTVDFVRKDKLKMSTKTVEGTLRVTEVDMHNSANSSSAPLAGTEFGTTAGEYYSGRTDENGSYKIDHFEGVEDGTYSMLVKHGDLYCYQTFTFGDSDSYQIEVPQFGPGIFFPSSVAVSLDGTSSNDNKIQLREESNVEVTVWVYNQVNSPYTIKSVELNYYQKDGKGNLIKPEKPLYAESTGKMDGNYSQYISKVSAASMQANTQLYVDIVGTKNIVVNGETQTVEVRCGEINSGYEFISPITDTSIPIKDDIPLTPGAQNALSVNLDDIEIPFIGTLDMGLNGKNGGFFVLQTDPNDPSVYYMTAGFSINPIWATGLPADKYDQANKTYQALQEAEQNQKPKGDTSNLKQDIVSDKDSTGNKTPSVAKSGLQPKLCVYPAAMLKFGFKNVQDEDGKVSTKVILFELAVGADEHVIINQPYIIYGVPTYITFSMNCEQYVQYQLKMDQDNTLDAEDDKTAIAYDEELWKNTSSDGQAEEQSGNEQNFYFADPMCKLGLKGGVGFNNLADLYIEGSINFKLIFQAGFDCDVGGALGVDIGLGANALIFGGTATINFPEMEFGNHDLYEQLAMITNLSSASLMEQASVGEMKFSLAERSTTKTAFTSGTISSDVLEENAFRNTQVKMLELGNGSIMAVFLADNGAEEGSANFLNAAYTISKDGGSTWSGIKAVSSSDHLQFGVETFELEDCMLMTWSEGNIDAQLKDVDMDELTAAQIAKALNAMNLKGRYFSKRTGMPIGKAFTIAESTGVALAALDAVEDANHSVYVYYERNQYPTDEDATVETLLQQERTIACAVKGRWDRTWTSHSITAGDEDEKKSYRITEVVPFSHDGITGEVLVLDRDGKVVIKDEDTGKLTASNEDRQIYLRFHANDSGTESSALVPLTEADGCAKNVRVVSDDDNLYLFWNQDGRLVYLSDFVETSDEYQEGSSQAVAVVDTATHKVTVPEQADGIGYGVIANSDSFGIGTEYSASMSDNGAVLLSWIGDAKDEEDADLVSADEIYGVMLEPKETDGLHQLNAIGSPVSLTEESSVLGKMDSICLSDESFLLAYSQLDGKTRRESTKAAVRVLKSSYEPKLTVTNVEAPDYPMPGSEMTVQVTVRNDGLQTLNGVKTVVSGVGSGAESESDSLLPGEERTLSLTVAVPENFSAKTDLKVTASGLQDQSAYTDKGSTTIYYDSYFIPVEMAQLSNIPNTSNYVSQLEVCNVGNAAGKPEVSYLNYVPGSNDEKEQKRDSLNSKTEVAPGESAQITYELKDTLATQDNWTSLQIRLGEGYDQSVEGYVPTPKTLERGGCTEHDFEQVITKATTSKDGKIVEVCKTCGEEGKTTKIYRPKKVTLSKTSYTYDGKTKKPTVKVTDRKGKTISSKNYTVSYSKGCKYVGKYTVTVTFKGSQYSGKMTSTFKVNPPETSLTSLSAKSKGFTAKWKKKTKQSTGYQIQYCTNKNFTGSSLKTVKITKNATTSKKISKLKAKKKYYVRIRTYKTVRKTQYYSGWSKVKTVTTKK